MRWEQFQMSSKMDYLICLQAHSKLPFFSKINICVTFIIDSEKGGIITVGQFQEGAKQGTSF